MILLDTNIISEISRKQPDAGVITWLDQQPPPSLWIASISVLEVRYGLYSMRPGRQQEFLTAAFEEFCAEVVENRIVTFDSDAAHETAKLMAERKKRGFSIDLRDAMIAGIALSRRATVATRNTRHYHDLHVPVVNPWEQGAKS